MPESTCLHIQDHESAPIRVVDLPWISVRIGRAAFCEVRLSADDLADEACRLYRRGRTWHLVPAGGKRTSKVLLDGRAVDEAHPLPFNVPFQIGPYWLTLRQDREVNPDWGMYPSAAPERPGWDRPGFGEKAAQRDHPVRADLVVEAKSVVEAPFKPDWRPRETSAAPLNATDLAPSASVKDRWETRWRVAGAQLKARSRRSEFPAEPVPPPFETGFDSVPLKEPTNSSARAKIDPRREPMRPASTPGEAPTLRPSEYAPYPEPASSPSTAASPWEERPGAKGQAEVGSNQGPDVDADIPRQSAAPVPAFEIEDCTYIPPIDDAGIAADDQSWYEMPVLVPQPEFEDNEPEVETPVRTVRGARRPSVSASASSDTGRAPVGSSRRRKRGDGKRESSARVRTDRDPGSRAATESVAERAARRAAWPSAKDILASHPARRHPQSAVSSGGRPQSETGQTLSRPPDQWTLPHWLAGPPAAALVVAFGLFGGVLSWWWAADAYSVSIMTGRLMTADAKAQRAALPESVAPAGGTWTRTTAQHLAHWAIFLSQGDPEKPAAPREVEDLLDRALQIAPLNPTARLALAQLEHAEKGAPVSQRALGLSRDTVSLCWCARRLLASGDKEGALKIFQKALALATHNDPWEPPLARFSDDPNIPRYLLPGEERVQDIVRELVTANEWTFREWSAALRTNPAIRLAAARLLKKLGQSEADTLLDEILEDHPAVDGARTTTAIIAAAQAEALALKSRWRQSEERYRLAIDSIDDATIKRIVVV